MCGMTASAFPTSIAARSGRRFWIGALVQLSIATIFMLVFGFPKFMIAIFGVMIVVGTALSAWAKTKPFAALSSPQLPIAHPVLFKVLSLTLALCFPALVASFLFGFVAFINNWNDWHRYQGQPYHVTTFQVTRAYFQKVGKGGIDAYASGTVDGDREWMNLRPYLQTVPRSQGELEARVPSGTSIPIYLFPELKGRLRVRVYSETPPAEAYHRTAMNAANYGLGGAALSAIVIFVLVRLRRMCFAETAPSIQELAASQGR